MTESQVTVVCTSYNYGQYIAHALDSFLSQRTDFEFDILVVDDCSTDNSLEILEEYRKRFPSKVKVVQNKENKGLTKTWIDICKQVTAKYIARCDADDFWIDEYKLQKQFDMLESSPTSKWCNTDFHIVDENDAILYENVFKNGPIPYANTYEKMLATKGMTLPSSWMVETELMQMVNNIIDPSSVDDGFPMQLEFFNMTELTFISEATVAYRMTQNSDSRPQSSEKMNHRINGLLETQLFYLNKYPQRDMQEIIKIQFEQDAKQELRAFEMHKEIMRLRRQVSEQIESISQQSDEIVKLSEIVEHIKSDNERLQQEYSVVINSRRWTIPTKLINLFRRNR